MINLQRGFDAQTKSLTQLEKNGANPKLSKPINKMDEEAKNSSKKKEVRDEDLSEADLSDINSNSE